MEMGFKLLEDAVRSSSMENIGEFRIPLKIDFDEGVEFLLSELANEKRLSHLSDPPQQQRFAGNSFFPSEQFVGRSAGNESSREARPMAAECGWITGRGRTAPPNRH